MSVERAKIKTAKLIAEERMDTILFAYTYMAAGLGLAGGASITLIGLSLVGGLSAWTLLIMIVPFLILFGIWKNKIAEYNAMRMLEELQIKPDAVVRDLPQPF